MTKKANIQNLKPFKKGDPRINRTGANRKLVSHINHELKKQGYDAVTSRDIIGASLTLMNLPLSKIVDIARKDNDDYPLYYKLAAKELTGSRGMEMMEKILDRALGKAQQKVDVTSKGKPIINLIRGGSDAK